MESKYFNRAVSCTFPIIEDSDNRTSDNGGPTVVGVYKKYGAILFKGVEQLILFPEK